MYKKMIISKLADIQELPTMFNVAIEVNKLTSEPSTSVYQIEHIIKNDLALTAKVLKLANSTVYGGTVRIISLNQAIARLGFKEINKMALAVSILNNFKPIYISYEKFWMHSIVTAYTAVKLNEYSETHEPSERLFTGALMHDIGILLFELHFPTLYKKVLDIVKSKNYELRYIEREILGITHSEIGSLLLKRWRIPEEITSMIQFHHTPFEAEISSRETKLIYLANYIANNRGYDNGASVFPDFFHDDIWFELGISTDDIPQIISEVNEDIEKAKEFLKIGGV